MKEIAVCNYFRLLIGPSSCFPACGVCFLFISKHILFNICVVMARVLNNPKNVCGTLLMPPLLTQQFLHVGRIKIKVSNISSA